MTYISYLIIVLNNTMTLYLFLIEIHDFGAGNVEVGLRSYKYISTEYNHYNAFYHCIGLGARMVLPMVGKVILIIVLIIVAALVFALSAFSRTRIQLTNNYQI